MVVKENKDRDIRSVERKRLAKLLAWMQEDSVDDTAQNEPGDEAAEPGNGTTETSPSD